MHPASPLLCPPINKATRRPHVLEQSVKPSELRNSRLKRRKRFQSSSLWKLSSFNENGGNILSRKKCFEFQSGHRAFLQLLGSAVHELRDVGQQPLAVLEQVERVDGVGVLRHADLLRPGAAQRVPTTDAHHRRREPAPGAGGQERAPQPGDPLGGPERRVPVAQLRRGRRLAAEERLEGDQAGDGGRRSRRRGSRPPPGAPPPPCRPRRWSA
jgi:hypothetical protein